MPRFAALLLAAVLGLPAGQPAPASRTFTGIVSDDTCASSGHARMRMGPTDAECTLACVEAHGSAFALQDGKTVYLLSAQQKLDEFAGRRVTIVGVLDEKARLIRVESIARASE